MKLTKTSLPFAALMVLGAAQMAAAQQTFSLADGSGFNELRADPLNVTFTASVTTAYTVGGNFTTGGAPLLTANHTFDYSSEASVAFYNDGFPGLYASASMGGAAATYTTYSLPTGLRTMTGTLIGSALALGSTTKVEMYESYNDQVGGPDGTLTGGTTVTLNAYTPPTAPSATDLGTISAGNSIFTTNVPLLASGQVKWYKFTVPSNVAAPDFFEIWTSDDGSGTEDTEIGVYTTTGTLVANNDDAPYPFSDLVWGVAGPSGMTGTPAASLASGTYYLAVGRFNVTFNATGWDATSTGTATVPFNLNLATSVGGGGAQHLTGTLNLQDSVGAYALSRTISYSVMQGTSSVASGTITANAGATAYDISVPATVTGASTIVFDGSSWLKRNKSVTLTGASQVTGAVNMQNGDVDQTGEVDAGDIDNVIANFGQMWPGGAGNVDADCDVSGEVDAADIDIVIANFGGLDD